MAARHRAPASPAPLNDQFLSGRSEFAILATWIGRLTPLGLAPPATPKPIAAFWDEAVIPSPARERQLLVGADIPDVLH
jgi:hypothetical protein